MSTVRSRRGQKNILSKELLDQLINEFVEKNTREMSLLKDFQAGKRDFALSSVQNFVDLYADEDASREDILELGRHYVRGYLQRKSSVNNNNSCATTSGVISVESAELSNEDLMPRETPKLRPRRKMTKNEQAMTIEEQIKRIKLKSEVKELMRRCPYPKKKEVECAQPNPRRSRPTDVWPAECIDEKKDMAKEVPANLMPTRLGIGAARTKDQLVKRCRTLTRSSSSFPRLATVEEFESLYSTKFGSSLKDDLDSFDDDWEEIINDYKSSQSCAFMTRIKAKILPYENFMGNDPRKYKYIAPDSFDHQNTLAFCPIDRIPSENIEKMKRDWQSFLPGLIDEKEISHMKSHMHDYRYLAWAVGCDTIEQVRDYLAPKGS